MPQESAHEPAARPRVLLVDPDPDAGGSVEAWLADIYDVVHVASGDAALAALIEHNFDAALVDLGEGDGEDLGLLNLLHEVAPGVPQIALTASYDAGLACEAVAHGAQDALAHPEITSLRLATAIRCAITRTQRSHLDSLTGLPNRALLLDRLNHAINHARRYDEQLAVMFFDLDRFKMVNDTLGHEAGDALLKTVAGRLRHSFRDSDTVARLGGDEFIAVAGGLGSAVSAASIAKKAIEVLSRPIRLGGEDVLVSPSIGISVFPLDGNGAEQLITAADAAMYRAKQDGGNSYRFYRPDMNADAVRRLGLAFALQRALDRQEYVLHYQPQFDLQAQRVTGVEALLRWQHPERGLVPPDQFIPLAEELGLMRSLGAWVLREACAQASAWRREGLGELRVAVNLSAHQFVEQDLLPTVLRCLEAADLAPQWLDLELTESAVMRDPETTRETLAKLAEIGVRISVDDFGTGYSSLSYLKRFPLHALKIDRTFVNDMTVDANDAAIVRTVIALARHLDLQAVAEGVETEPQLEFLRAIGCQLAQGFHLARPVPAERIPAEVDRLNRLYNTPQLRRA